MHSPADLDGWPKAGRTDLGRAVVNDLGDASACKIARRAHFGGAERTAGIAWGPGATMRYRNLATAPVTFASTRCARGRL